jgi:hypothetical protein
MSDLALFMFGNHEYQGDQFYKKKAIQQDKVSVPSLHLISPSSGLLLTTLPRIFYE